MTDPQAPPMLQREDLRLRGDPPRVMRLSRRALAIAGVAGSAGIGAILIYALQPAAPAEREELYETDNRPVTDTVTAGPQDYAEVPRLGPPLPGDLGRPILSAQERGAEIPPPPMGTSATPAPGSPADPARAARERRRQESDAARTSKMFASGEAAVAPGPAVPSSQLAPVTTPPASAATFGGSDQATKRDFLRASVPDMDSRGLTAPGSPWTVQAGSVIPAALITGIRSDLPGTITAQVTRNVYDSVTGSLLLIPQGSRLIGEYDSQVSFGQNRVLLAWDRLILPDGRSIQLGRLPGADASGYSGAQDRVDRHWGGMLRAALVSTLLGIGTHVGESDDELIVRALREGSSETIGRTGQELVRRQLGVPPTLTIRPGFELRVLVTRDLVLAP